MTTQLNHLANLNLKKKKIEGSKLELNSQVSYKKPDNQPSSGSSPQLIILHGRRGTSDLLVSCDSSFSTTSIPSMTCPNTTWNLSNHGVYKMRIYLSIQRAKMVVVQGIRYIYYNFLRNLKTTYK